MYVFSMFYGGFVGFTVWMKVKRPSYVMTMNGVSRDVAIALLFVEKSGLVANTNA